MANVADARWFGYYERAADFWRCAELALYQEKHIGRELFVPLFGPGVMLHLSVELYFKGYLLVSGIDEDALKTKYGHNLIALYREVVAREPDLAGAEDAVGRLNVFGHRQAGAIYPGPRHAAGYSDGGVAEALGPVVQQLDLRLRLRTFPRV